MSNKENKKYKNSVFVDLFYEDESADANDIALYNALHEKELPEGTSIRRFRVDDVLYMNFQNDMSFGVEDKVIVFGEHQSTINANMPLRSLMYIGRAYEQIVPVADRYRRRLAKIPTPEFYTFYNGKKEFSKEKVLYLSDAFQVMPTEGVALELKVKVINIKPDMKHELLEKCRVLREYSLFMECIGKHQVAGEADAVERAIKECMEAGILQEYLKRKGSQVINMLIAEYDYETDIKVQRGEAWEDGKLEGKIEGKAEDILELLAELGPVSSALQDRVMSETDLEVLKKWLKLAAKADSIEQFEVAIQEDSDKN